MGVQVVPYSIKKVSILLITAMGPMKQNDCISDELENESVVVTFEDGSNHQAFKA